MNVGSTPPDIKLKAQGLCTMMNIGSTPPDISTILWNSVHCLSQHQLFIHNKNGICTCIYTNIVYNFYIENVAAYLVFKPAATLYFLSLWPLKRTWILTTHTHSIAMHWCDVNLYDINKPCLSIHRRLTTLQASSLTSVYSRYNVNNELQVYSDISGIYNLFYSFLIDKLQLLNHTVTLSLL